MRLIATRKEHQNRSPADPWTVVHLSAGLALGMLGVPLRGVLAAAVAYELVEQVFERHPPGQHFFKTMGPESLANALIDTSAFALGHWLGRRWNGT